MKQEEARAFVVRLLLGCAGGILLFSGWASTTSNWDHVKDWMQIVLPTFSAFLGSAFGFYFSVIVSFKERR